MSTEKYEQGPASLDSVPFLGSAPLEQSGGQVRRRARVTVPESATAHLTGELGRGRRSAQPAPREILSAGPGPLAEFEQEFAEPVDEDEYWVAITEIYEEAANLQATALEQRRDLDQDQIEELGRNHFQTAIRNYLTRSVTAYGTESGWDEATRNRAARDLFNRMFRLGRYQDFVEDETIENVHINGYENVFVKRVDGSTERVQPVARNDDEMVAEFSKFLQRKGEAARPLDQANPDVDADLMESVRLAATLPPLSLRPSMVLRIHRHLDITLDDMVRYENLTPAMAHLLKVAVAAERSVIVSGYGGVGKTTLLRALADQIDPYEQIVTIENERELHLHKLSSRVLPPVAFEYRAPGESGAGEWTLDDAVNKALRKNARRIFVGEVRGGEISAMIRAMQGGAGTFSTAHAETPEECIDVLLGLGSKVHDHGYTARQLGRLVHFVVQMDTMVKDGTKIRRITEISQVTPHEMQPGQGGTGVGLTPLFKLDPSTGDTTARFVSLPTDEKLLERLKRHGLDTQLLQSGGAL